MNTFFIKDCSVLVYSAETKRAMLGVLGERIATFRHLSKVHLHVDHRYIMISPQGSDAASPLWHQTTYLFILVMHFCLFHSFNCQTGVKPESIPMNAI